MASYFAFNPSDALEGFVKSWFMILVSEIGDKTFFIAAIMAMRNPRRTVFAGALAALAAMTVLSAVMGWAAPNLISKKYTHYAAIILFICFGLRSLYDAAFESGGASEELEEVEKELAEKHPTKSASQAKLEDSESRGKGRTFLRRFFSPIFVEAFVLTFLAEWGDRSQIATIGLAASTDVFGVTLGGILGHGICTGAAVMGGRHLATHINERTVHLVGGLLFIAFGLHAIWDGVPA